MSKQPNCFDGPLARRFGHHDPGRQRRVSYEEQQAMPDLQRPARRNNFVAPEPATAIVPARHEVIDPYAASAPQPVQYLVKHEYNPQSRAAAMLVKTSSVTIFLAVLTAAAMVMFTQFVFFLWLFLASVEWVLCFVLIAILDWRETPSALTWHLTDGYLDMMRYEQRARLKSLYNYSED